MQDKKEMPPDGANALHELQEVLSVMSGAGFNDFTLMCEADQRSALTRAWKLSVEASGTQT